jgi:hypothetical protein
MPTEKWKAEPNKRPKHDPHPVPMRQVPVPMTTAQFLAVLDDIRGRVAVGDSWEGSIEWMLPAGPTPDNPQVEIEPDVEFEVRGMYRIGNLEGQGGYRVIGEFQQ